jgi:hypothetical protein
MRNITILAILACVIAVAIGIGSYPGRAIEPRAAGKQGAAGVPHIGRIQVLNGCGISGAATAGADFLRSAGFDVKNIGDADTWNYPFTIVVSRTTDTTVARQVADALSTDSLVVVRDGENEYDVTVVLGTDFAERIQ